MRILIAGDTHGNAAWWSRLIEYAITERCKVILQLGDFGYWEHTSDGKRFLDRLARKLQKAGVVVYFIDGNHENHPMLWDLYPPTTEGGFCVVRSNLYYIPRGTTWEWGGLRFLGLGGAWSIDKKWRLEEEQWRGAPGTMWWPTETLTDDDVAKASAVGKVDILVAHDCPWEISLPGIAGEFPLSNDNRMRVSKVIGATLPSLVLHGHYHMRNSDSYDYAVGVVENELKWHHVQVEGYHCDGVQNREAWGVLDTDTWHAEQVAA